MVAEQMQYRNLLVQIVRRDLTLRYNQTFIGAGWAIFIPLVNTVMFTIVVTRFVGELGETLFGCLNPLLGNLKLAVGEVVRHAD